MNDQQKKDINCIKDGHFNLKKHLIFAVLTAFLEFHQNLSFLFHHEARENETKNYLGQWR